MHSPDKRLDKSHEIVKLSDVLCQDVRDLHRRLMDLSAAVNHGMKSASLSLAEQADAGFLFRDLMNVFDECRKEAKATQELAGKLIAARVIQDSVGKPGASDNVKGKLCSATAQMRMEAQLPEKGTPERLALLVHFGVPKELAESELVKPDWDKMAEHVTELAQKGKKLPPGVGKSWPKFWCVFRRNSNGG